jgi:hypothetical protein
MRALGPLDPTEVHQSLNVSVRTRMENRKHETGNSKPVTPFSGFTFPVSGFLFFILRINNFRHPNPADSDLSPEE